LTVDIVVCDPFLYIEGNTPYDEVISNDAPSLLNFNS